MFEAGHALDQMLGVVPEMNALQDGVHEVRDGAVECVFRIGVVERVLMRGLEHADVLKE
jgi:hypothetical protein